ncbi:MAG: UvrD-helicase domain-containing protein [Lentisphaerae bacterium]|nr:UvrD-helicase domain-containing protein [Lentisphaerota bacterium]
MSKFTTGLNDEQRRAVLTTEGPLLVLAGAGTGKTRVITHRIAHLLAGGVPARAVLAMTFTNKAAGEMKERIAKLVPHGAGADLTVGTFHAFCVKALRQFGDRVGLRRNFGICDADDQLMAMKQALRELQLTEADMPPRLCLSRVSLLKSRLLGAEGHLESGDQGEVDLGRAYQRYDAALRASGVLDFDDLLVYMVKLLQDRATLAPFRERFRYLCVDEYQDTNGPQYEIVRQIGGEHRNVCVVGDDDQSIYGWRGADVSKILNFERDFPGAAVVRLETNYRSTYEILQGANAVIRHNTSRHEKTLRSAAGNGEAIIVRRLRDENGEAEFVVADMLQRLRDQRVPLGDLAVLFRTAVQPRVFEMQLRRAGIPYNLVGGMSFFDRKEVRDVLSYLKLIANPSDELALLRVINTPPRGVGGTSVEKMLAVAAQHRLPLADVIARGSEFAALPAGAVVGARAFLESLAGLRHLQTGKDLVTLVKQVVQVVGYQEEIKRCYPEQVTRLKRWEAVTEIMNMAEAHGRMGEAATLASFLEDVALNAQDDNDKEEPAEGRLTLMTLHSAKGLEFGEVYLVGMEEGLLPHARSVADGNVEEERRLAYVGITRARRRLTVTYTESRARYGKRATVLPSRFLYEMLGKQTPPDLLHQSAAVAGKLAAVEEEGAVVAAAPPAPARATKPAAAAKKAPAAKKR